MTAESPRPIPEELLQTKEGILEQWRKLPADHQATMLLVLLKEIRDAAVIDWVRTAILGSDRSEPLRIATPERLSQLAVDEEHLARLTYTDLKEIESRILSSFDHDEFWDELLIQLMEFHAELLLATKACKIE